MDFIVDSFVKLENIYDELNCYAYVVAHEALRNLNLGYEFLNIVAFVYSRYCTIKRLKEGIKQVIHNIQNEKLCDMTKHRLLRFVHEKVRQFNEQKLVDIARAVVSYVRRKLRNIVIRYENVEKNFWQCFGLMITDLALSNGIVNVVNNEMMQVLIRTFGTLKLSFNIFYLEASTFDIVSTFVAQPLGKQLLNRLRTYIDRLLNNDFSILPDDYWCWVRLFSGLFNGDGFVKIKHQYAIDVGISCGNNLKGEIIRKILKIGEEKGFYTLGVYDSHSCKQYLKLDERTLKFLCDVLDFIYHFERRFKIERYLVHKGYVSVNKYFPDDVLFKICVKKIVKRIKGSRVYTILKPSDKVCVDFLINYLRSNLHVSVSYYKSRNEIVIPMDLQDLVKF